MQKIDDGFQSLRTARAPDLWGDISGRTPRPLPGPSLPRRVAIAALALAIAGTGSWLVARAFLASEPGVKPADEVPGPVTPRLGPSATFPGAHGGGPLYAFGSVWIPQHREPPEEDFVLRIDPQSLEVIARIPVRSAPGWEIGNSGFAASADAVWVVGGNGDQASLDKIDPATNEVVGGFPLGVLEGGTAADVAVHDRTLWVSLFGRGEVSVVSLHDTYVPDVVTSVKPEGDWIREVFAVQDRIVVHTRGGGEVNTLTVIDPATGEIVASNSTGEALFTDWNGFIWSGDGQDILQIDPHSARVVERYRSEKWISHTSLEGGEGGLWFIGYDANDHTVPSELVRFNVESGQIDASIELGGEPVALTVGGGAIWVLGYEGKLTRIDLLPA